MKFEIIPTNSTKYSISFEPKDKLYQFCRWATIILDHDNYTMFAETDCGNYTYGWTPTPEHESFLHLMCRIEEEYLLGKIANMSVLDLEKSKKRTISNIRSYCELSKTETSKLCNEIQGIDDRSEDLFCMRAHVIMISYDLRDTFEIIDCCKDYPTGAKTFAQIFCKVLQPQLKKQLAADVA